ncbi:MAG: universal stress protein [Hyphomonas sp.]
MLNIILAAVDLDDSEAVLARAAQLAANHGAWLIVLHVIDDEALTRAAAVAPGGEPALRDLLKREATARLDAAISGFGRVRRNDVLVAFGAAHEVIARMAGERSVDLVVLGPGRSKGRSLRDKVLGSTADRVIRTSPAPVLVVRSAAPEPYRQALVSIDYSEQSIAAARAVCKLAPDARLQLVHVINVPLAFEEVMLRAGTSAADLARYRMSRIASARNALRTFARETMGFEKAATRILEGEPGPVLCRLARSKSVGVLAIGPHGRGAVVSALLGSVTQRVLREAACDVLVASTRR